MRKYSIIKKINKKSFLKILISFLILISIGCLYEKFMERYENKKFKQPGRLFDVYDHKMHIFTEGEGEYSVIFTVGSGTPSAYTDYYYIQKEISKIARTISYDRLGYGWSEMASTERNIHQIVKELHALLQKSGERAPYILVGHSLSSLEVIHFAQEYPDEVKGIVLIDGGNPEFYASLDEKGTIIPMYMLKAAGKCGLIRSLGNMGAILPLTAENKRAMLLPEDINKMDMALFYKSQSNKYNIAEVKCINENATVVIEGGNIGDVPLVILTAELSIKTVGGDKWKNTQEQLKELSTNSKQKIVYDSSHYIHWDKPNIVIEEIKELLNNLK